MPLFRSISSRFVPITFIVLLAAALLADGVAGARAQEFRPPANCSEVSAATTRGGAQPPKGESSDGSGCAKEEASSDGRLILVKRVIDGDTIVLENDERVRYVGVDTPEYTTQKEPFGKEATELNKRLVEGKRVYLVKGITDRDGFGRLLRYVFVEGVMVEAELVREGLAEAKEYQKGQPYAVCVAELEREAKAERRGMWSAAK